MCTDRYIDSHIHLDNIDRFHPPQVARLHLLGARFVSWAYCSLAESTRDLVAYLERQRQTIHRLRQRGIVCWYLTGIHPRNITADLDPERIPALLQPYLDDPWCRGIGEIGLEHGTARECAVLRAQLSLAPALVRRNKVFGVHSPRGNKQMMTAQLIDELAAVVRTGVRVVIDHCTAHTAAAVQAAGCWAGLTLSPEKLSAGDVGAIVTDTACDTSRLLLNSDAGEHFHCRLQQFVRRQLATYPDAQPLLLANPQEFYAIHL